MPKDPTKNQGWWQDYFLDHPGLKAKQSDAYTRTGSSAKAKVYCITCFELHTTAIAAEDQLIVDGEKCHQQSVREISDIQTHCTPFFPFLFGIDSH